MAEENKGQAQSASAQSEEKKNRQKKINKMTPQELEDAIKKTQQTMGGLSGRYGGILLKRKTELENK
ncbi:MAG: hypothetical protein ABH836_03870 [Candidatus Omnitrophota bacterium]